MKMIRRYLTWVLMAAMLVSPFTAAASQHDMDIATADANTGVTFRAAVNAALQALASLSSGATAPTVPYAYQLWADTGNDQLTIRNAANTAWITVGTLSEAYLGLASLSTQNEFTASQMLKGDALLWRFNDSGAGGGEFALRSDGNTLQVLKNTGSEASPTWAVLTSFGGTAGSSTGNIQNLKPVVNAAANRLDVFAKSNGAAPDTSNVIWADIPDGNGNTLRGRSGSYASGTSQIILADAANYWSKGSLDGEVKTAWLYAIWDGTGIVWALAGSSGFTTVSTTTTATADDYFLLEDGSAYTRNASHHCAAVAKIRYQYDTGDSPDHAIQASGENAPQVAWQPRSDYAIYAPLAANITAASDIADQAFVSATVKQAGQYLISASVDVSSDAAASLLGFIGTLRLGSTYSTATTMRNIQAAGANISSWNPIVQPSVTVIRYLNAGDIIWIGGAVYSNGGNRTVHADGTNLTIVKID